MTPAYIRYHSGKVNSLANALLKSEEEVYGCKNVHDHLNERLWPDCKENHKPIAAIGCPRLK